MQRAVLRVCVGSPDKRVPRVAASPRHWAHSAPSTQPCARSRFQLRAMRASLLGSSAAWGNKKGIIFKSSKMQRVGLSMDFP